MRTVSILYHDVVRFGAFDSSGFLIPGADRYKLRIEEFEGHLAAIAAELRIKATILTECPVKSQKLQLLITFSSQQISSIRLAS
jgi:hypothetical protein